MTISSFLVFDRMRTANDPALKMAPLSNIVRANYYAKRGTDIVIGWPGDATAMIERGDIVGGLFIVERKRYEEVKAEMEKEVEMTLNPSSIVPPDTPLNFRTKIHLAPNGDVQYVHLVKDGQTVGLTVEQATSLVKEISARLGL